MFELTLAIVKPHIIKHPHFLNAIKNLIVKNNFKVVRSQRSLLTLKLAEKFYEEHREKFFYNRLVTFMSSGPSEFYILAKENAIKDWRRLMGPTKVYRAQFSDPTSIRGLYGFSDTRNATHGSDSTESLKREIGIFFPAFNIDAWYKNEEIMFRENNVRFCQTEFVHKCIDVR